MQVRDVLRTKGGRVISIEPESTVSDAVSTLVHHNIGSLPVLNHEGRLVGIFTERDVLRGVCNRGDTFCKALIGDIMTLNPVTCDVDDEVHHAMGKMSEHHIGQLPVMEHQKLVGVVSVGDVVKILYEKADTENRHLINYIYGPG